MHPGFLHWWKEAQRASAEGADERRPHAPAGWSGRPQQRRRQERQGARCSGPEEGAGFGVRRPLRFMAHRLELSEAQVAELAAILDELKIERAQEAVDHRRSVGVFADVLQAGDFDAHAAQKAAALRVQSAERMRDAVVHALQRTHALLEPEQRKQLAYLLRSGQLTI